MLSVERNKVFQFPSDPAAISEAEKIEPYYSNELRSIWQHYDRNWLVYSKKSLEVLF